MTQDIRTIRIATQGPAGPAGLYPQAAWDAGSVPYPRSTVLAHNDAIWLALRQTSVEPSVAAPDDWSSWLDFGDYATLGDDGKIPIAELPAIAINDAFTIGSQSAMLALTAQRGDIAIRTDLNTCYVLSSDSPATLADWKELLTPPSAVLSVNGQTGAVSLAKSDVGLANVPNVDATARANHTGTQAASTVTGLAAIATSGSAADLSTGTLPSARLSGSYSGVTGTGTLTAGATGAGFTLDLASSTLSGTVPNAKLANSSVTLGSTAMSLGSTYGTIAGAITWNGQQINALGTITTSQPHQITETWNASGTTFVALQVGVTNTASAAQSLLIDAQVGGSSMFSVRKDGTIYVAATPSANNFIVQADANNAYWNTPGSSGVHEWSFANGEVKAIINSTNFRVGSAMLFGFSSGTSAANNALDVTLSRVAAGVIQIGTTAANASGSLNLTNIKATGSQIDFTGVPTSDPHVVGRLWANSGVLTVSAG